MFAVETYAAVRHFVFIEGASRREAARVFGLSRETVAKMCRYSAPPGYVRTKPPPRPKLGSLIPVIDAILEADKAAPAKQRHTAKRIFERLRNEHGYAGGYTAVKDYVRLARSRSREMFVPLAHPPGHAQVDFGECLGVIGGVRMKLHVFCFDLPQSDACFLKAYAAETTEAFLDGHVSAFGFFGGIPLSILYDNTKLAVARILGDGGRRRTQAFTELVSHFLFDDRFGRPGKGNDKIPCGGSTVGRRNQREKGSGYEIHRLQPGSETVSSGGMRRRGNDLRVDRIEPRTMAVDIAISWDCQVLAALRSRWRHRRIARVLA